MTNISCYCAVVQEPIIVINGLNATFTTIIDNNGDRKVRTMNYLILSFEEVAYVILFTNFRNR